MTKTYHEHWFEEAIGWATVRAIRDAMRNLPEGIPETDDMHVSVQIRVRSTSWPGPTASGRRSLPTKIGEGSCLYLGVKELSTEDQT
jgi:hypothetical protein